MVGSLRPSQHHTVDTAVEQTKDTHTGHLGTFWVTVINPATCWLSRHLTPCWQKEVGFVKVDLVILALYTHSQDVHIVVFRYG